MGLIQSRNILVAHYRPDIVSGAENSIADLVDQIDSRFHITMLVPGEGKLTEYYRKRGFDVWVKRVETPRRVAPGLHQVQSWMLSRSIKQRRIDAVLCNTFPASSRVATAARLARIPYAIFLRDYTPDTPLHRKMLQQADAVFAISKDVIHHHQAMADPEKFALAYNFINPAPILERCQKHSASGKRLLPFSEDTPVVGLVGRLTPYKQPDLFIRAIPMILAQVPEARFLLIGSAQEKEKPYEQGLHNLVNQLGISDKVIFMGQRSDAVELTSELTVACLASGREPLGRVILEAHILGVPVVVPDTGGPAEIVQDGVTGLTFSSTSGDAAAHLAGHISRLLQDGALRKCLASAGQREIHQTFASHRNVETLESLIDTLAGSKKVSI